MEQHWYIENSREKYGSKVIAERQNFLFLKDGTMVYPTSCFGSYIDAMIDAVHKGEDLQDLISLVFPEKIDHPIVYQKILKLL